MQGDVSNLEIDKTHLFYTCLVRADNEWKLISFKAKEGHRCPNITTGKVSNYLPQRRE